MQPQQNKSSIGSLIGTIIIIALIVLGGLYFWGKRIEEAKQKQILLSENNSTETVQNSDSDQTALSGGDDVDSIDADLKATNTTNLSSELDQPLE